MKLFCWCIVFFYMTCLITFGSSTKYLILTDQKSTFYDALTYCRDLGGFVPTDDEIDSNAPEYEKPDSQFWVSWQIKSHYSGTTYLYLGRKAEKQSQDIHEDCLTRLCCVRKSPEKYKYYRTICEEKLSIVCGFDSQAQWGYQFLKMEKSSRFKNLSDSIAWLEEQIVYMKASNEVMRTEMNEGQVHFNEKLAALSNIINEDKDEIAQLKSQFDEHRQAISWNVSNFKAEHDDLVFNINAKIDEATLQHKTDFNTHYGLINGVHNTVNETIGNLTQNISKTIAEKQEVQDERLNDILGNLKAEEMQLNKTVGHLSQEIVEVSQNLTKIVKAMQNLTNIQVQDKLITEYVNRRHEMMIYSIISFLTFSGILFILLKVVCVSCKRKKVKKEHSMKYSASQEQVEFVVDVKEAETEKSRNSLTRSDKSYQSNDMVHRYFDNNIYEEPFIQKDLLEEIYATHEEMTESKEN